MNKEPDKLDTALENSFKGFYNQGVDHCIIVVEKLLSLMPEVKIPLIEKLNELKTKQ